MAGRHLLVLNVHAYGHVLPTLVMVEELVRRGHRVTYVTSGQLAGPLERAGATVLRYESRIPKIDPFEEVGDDVGRPLNLFLEENKAILDVAESALANVPADLVLYDFAALHSGRILAEKWSRPAVQLHPVFVHADQFAQYRCMFEDPERTGDETAGVLEYRDSVQKLLAEHGVARQAPEFMSAVEDLNLVFLPESFQPDAAELGDRFVFVGPCLGARDFLPDWRPPEPERPVVLISLGTVFNENPEFFRTCAQAFADGDWHVVMTLGDRLDPARLGTLPGNVEAFPWVRHASVLEHAAVSVGQAGMGSTLESLAHGRPVVAVPQSGTQEPIAERLFDLGLGTVIRPAELSAERIRAAVDELAADRECLLRVRRTRREIEDAGGAALAADAIEAHLERAGRAVASEPFTN
ncbi:macrolide family glycosyltransferase [Spirillospora sp. NPDC029432]|uniref:macrolide family glycosyltransferase n=1 Tax=Spirillospora sp. NPDC029432 TaxID=3154599 RepID=UPI0034520FDE